MKKYLILYIGILISTVSCSSVRLISSDPPSRDMEKYTTFAFAKLSKRAEVKRANSESIKKYVQQTIIKEMTERGYAYSEENPDLLVDLNMSLRDYQREQGSETRYSSRRNYYYNYNYGFGPQTAEIQTTAGMEASIKLTFADANSKQKLGEGTVEAQMAKKTKKSVLRLNEAIDLLMGRLVD